MKTLLKYFFLIYISFISYNNKVLSNPVNPYISSVSPSMNAVSVIKSSNISIIFTQDMNASTINGANIKVFGYQTGLLPVTIDYNPISKTANINPNQDFKIGEIISITLTDRIQTFINESILPFVYTFRIQAIGGNGIFARSSSINFIESAELKSGDIDGDGNIDLLVNDIIYKNNGNAFFTFFAELGITGIPEPGDFDSDGDLDILIENSGNIYFFRNEGAGAFIQAYSFTGYLGNFGDLNGDGFLDISSFLSVYDIEIIKNINGAFIRDSSFHFYEGCTEGGNYKDRILIDDMNNDGGIDVIGIHGHQSGGTLLFSLCRNYDLLKNNNIGIFSKNQIFSEQLVSSSLILFSDRDSKSFDFDNDGFVDILSPVTKLRNNGDGTFSRIANSGFDFSFSLISDFNGDGYLDLVSSIDYFSPVPLFTHLNDGSGNFVQSIGISGRFLKGTSGDFDNDGDIDLAVFDYNIHEVSILLNGDVSLPVELLSFVSELNSNSIILKWSTSTEENNSGFDIERSIVKGQTSEEWNKVSFMQGHGTTSSQINYEFMDRNLNSGKYKYRLKQIDFNGNFKYYDLANEIVIGSPEKFELSQNYPNPFNPITHLGFGISNLGFVSLKVYDVLGNEIKTLVNEIKPAGYYEVEFNGSNLPSGIYYYRIKAGSFSQVRKMMLVK